MPSPAYPCPWCGAVSDGQALNCPACGAPVDVRLRVTASGWTQAPARQDLAKLQFGRSFCQIAGQYAPVADFNLAAGDGLYFAHHILLWKDPGLAITTLPLKGAWKRALAGLPVVMTQVHGPGRIAFSRDEPGETLALPLQPGQAVDVREHQFLVATHAVTYDWFQTNVWFRTRHTNSKGETEYETHYPLGMNMDRFAAAQTPGLLLLHAAGNVFVRHLAPRETILVRPTALVFKESTVALQLHLERPSAGWSSAGNWPARYVWLRLHGPGRVAVSSVFATVAGEADPIDRTSAATHRNW